MAEETEFISRTGSIETGSIHLFRFIRDMRNFCRIIPQEVFKGWEADEDSCSFEVSTLGKASVRITEREADARVKYEGEALQNTSFMLWIQFREPEPGITRFRIVIRTRLNPFYKLMASKPVNEFLEKVVGEMEAFQGWTDIATDTQSL